MGKARIPGRSKGTLIIIRFLDEEPPGKIVTYELIGKLTLSGNWPEVTVDSNDIEHCFPRRVEQLDYFLFIHAINILVVQVSYNIAILQISPTRAFAPISTSLLDFENLREKNRR